jgi:hypothetical protein
VGVPLPPHPSRRVLPALSWIAGLYTLVCAAGCLGYRKLLYPAPHDDVLIAPPDAARRSFRDPAGHEVLALHFRAPADAPTVVHFHGNGESVRTSTPFARALRARGVGVVLVEYPGYGAAPGEPSEEALYAAAEAALTALAAEGIGPDRVVLSGISLGTGVAAEMATRGRGARLVLVAPYTSIPAVAGRIAPIVPTSVIVGDRFDTRAKAARILVPTLVIHGDEDGVIPFAMGRDVAGAIAGATFVPVQGGHHNDLFAVRPDLLDRIARHALGRP